MVECSRRDGENVHENGIEESVKRNSDGVHVDTCVYLTTCHKHTTAKCHSQTDCFLENKRFFINNFCFKKMYDEKKSDSDSSDSDGNEYYVVSKIKPSWLEDFKKGDLGAEFPQQKKMNSQKPIDLSREFLNDILKKVRNKQNEQQPTQSRAAQNAISTFIGVNTPATTQQSNIQMNGGPSVVAQMTAVPTQELQNVSIFVVIFSYNLLLI